MLLHKEVDSLGLCKLFTLSIALFIIKICKRMQNTSVMLPADAGNALYYYKCLV